MCPKLRQKGFAGSSARGLDAPQAWSPNLTPLRIAATALLPFACGYFLSYLLRAVNAVVAPDLVTDIGVTASELGLLTSAYLVAFALFQLPVGVLLDRYGPRRVQAALLSIAALGCLAFSYAPGFVLLFIARAVIGLGFAAGLMASLKATSLWVPLERRALANTAIMSMGALGIVVATEPTEWLVAALGWRSVFAVFAGLVLLCALAILAIVPERHSAARPASLSVQVGELLQIMRLPLFWRVVPLIAIAAGVQIGIQTLWAGPWFRDVMGLDRAGVARHLLWMAIAFMVGILGIGTLTDRLGRRGVSPMTVMTVCYLVYLAAQLVLVVQWLPLAVPAWLVIAATGQVAILAYPWFAARVGGELAGRSNATINFAMFVCAFAAQYGIGFIIGLFPGTATGYAPEAYAWAFGLCLGLQALAMAWYLAAPIASLRDAPT